MKIIGAVLLLVLQYVALPLVGAIWLVLNARFKDRLPKWLWWVFQIFAFLLLIAGLGWLALTALYLFLFGADVFNGLLFS